jgi:rRNA biogenesis protein RRP5
MAEARTEAEAEFDKEERTGNNKKKRNANVSLGMDPGDDDLGTLFGSATTGKLPRFANRITLKVSTLSIFSALTLSAQYIKLRGLENK